jgi:hypothetical protein
MLPFGSCIERTDRLETGMKTGLRDSESYFRIKAVPGPAHRAVCPACKRINDDYPAGVIQLSGSFFGQHKEEILNLI